MHGPEILIPLISVTLFFGIPIVAILTKHQQRMAELLHGSRRSEADARIDALQRDVAELKDLVHRQTIALDRLTTPLPHTSEIRERIGG